MADREQVVIKAHILSPGRDASSIELQKGENHIYSQMKKKGRGGGLWMDRKEMRRTPLKIDTHFRSMTTDMDRASTVENAASLGNTN